MLKKGIIKGLLINKKKVEEEGRNGRRGDS
jgi:hypothetical protein